MRAYLLRRRCRKLDAAGSKNVTAANFTKQFVSTFCFHDLPFQVHSVVATIDESTAPHVSDIAQAALGHGTFCSVPNTGAEVITQRASTGTFEPAGFFVVFN